MSATDTAAVWVQTAPRPEPKRDRYGRYLIRGKPHTRVTTFAETIDDRFNLEKWKQRMVALGIVARPDLYAQIASTPADDRAALNRLCDNAVEAAKGSAGANLGTALHRFTERIDAGEPLTVPAPWDLDIAAYRAELAAAGIVIDPTLMERVVVIDHLELAGTFDRLIKLPGAPLPVIADLKTGATLDFSWSTIAIQLACYANATHLYDIASDTTVPMVPVDKQRALVIHLPAGKATCTLHVIDIAAGWEAAQMCAGVRSWRKRKTIATPYTPAPAADVNPRDGWIRRRVASIVAHPAARDDLARNWPAGVPTLRQGGHDDDQLTEIARACDHIEAAHQLPFAEPDPHLVAARAAARRLRDEGDFDADTIRALHAKYGSPLFPALADSLLAGSLALAFTGDGEVSVVEAATNQQQPIDKEPT